MRDADVRRAVLGGLAIHHADDANTRVVEEMGIWSGSVRIDVAVINGELSGYELKSDRDTLERLPAQAELYSKVFDKLYLVVGSKHEGKARRIIPRWWGVIVASMGSDGVKLRTAREPKTNPGLEPLSVAQLLWRDEALGVLEEYGQAKGFRSKSVAEIHRRLAGVVPLDDLSREVRAVLKRRQGWLRQAISDQRHVPINADLDPGGAATGTGCVRRDCLDAGISPAMWNSPEAWLGD